MRFLYFLLVLVMESFLGNVEWQLQKNFEFSHLYLGFHVY